MAAGPVLLAAGVAALILLAAGPILAEGAAALGLPARETVRNAYRIMK